VAAALSGSVESHDPSEYEHKKKKPEVKKSDHKSNSKIVESKNSEVINEAYEGLDAKDFPSDEDEKKPALVVK
jgi:hypothetical protein